MSRIALLTPTLLIADAISNDVYGMQAVLRSRGHDVRLFANESTSAVEVFPLSKIKSFLKAPEDILIYHYSMGWDFGLDLLRQLKCRKVLKYHNITPPEFFAGISIEYETVCRKGREQVKDIATANCDLYLADSQYNAEELIREGADRSKCVVVPPFHNIDKLAGLAPDTSVLDQYVNHTLNILMVGRVAPNKGHGALIETLAAYREYYRMNARLLIVGKEAPQLAIYSHWLRQLAASKALDGAVDFVGGVTDEQLKAYYLAADFFLLTSEHEGFCVPLVEAMAMKVPIIAYASSAVPATIGDAGLVWPERNPYLLAASIDYLNRDESASAALGLRGRHRYEHLFATGQIAHQFTVAMSQAGLI